MGRLLLIIICFCGSLSAIGQSIEVDKKTGSVKVDGKDAFYLVQKNKSIFNSDFSLQNLDRQELAYIKPEQVDKYNSHTGKYETEVLYNFTFVQTGNSCLVKANTSFNTSKAIARAVAAAGLVEDGRISADAERKFIVMNKGNFLKDPNGDNNKVVVNVVNSGDKPRPSAPADISLKDNKVYNGGELVASFKRAEDNGYTVIYVYSADGNKTAEARHFNGNENEDWTVTVLADGKSLTLLYDPITPLEKLFKYLVQKGYL